MIPVVEFAVLSILLPSMMSACLCGEASFSQGCGEFVEHCLGFFNVFGCKENVVRPNGVVAFNECVGLLVS